MIFQFIVLGRRFFTPLNRQMLAHAPKGVHIPAMNDKSEQISAQDFEAASTILRSGGLVAMPTETVYGLACDATNANAVAGLYEAKGRPSFNPLIAHVSDLEMAKAHGIFTPLAEKLARHFWPGPLTLIVPRTTDSPIAHLACAGLDSIGLRCPDHPVALKLLQAAGRPLVAPSANKSGTISPTRAEHVREGLGDSIDLLLDGGPCRIGLESTIVRMIDDRPCILRPGQSDRAALEQVLGCAVSTIEPESTTIEAPGMMTSHYAPAARVRLNAQSQREDEAFLGFGDIHVTGDGCQNLSPAGDLTEAAANLFAMMRALDTHCQTAGLATLAVAPIPEEGLGIAINDRLRRAAAPRGD